MSKYAYIDKEKTKIVNSENLNVDNYKKTKFYCYDLSCSAILVLSNGIKGGKPFFKALPSNPHNKFCDCYNDNNLDYNIDSYTEKNFNFKITAINIINNNILNYNNSIYTFPQLIKLICYLKNNKSYNLYELSDLTITKYEPNSLINPFPKYIIINLTYLSYDKENYIIKCKNSFYFKVFLKFSNEYLFKKYRNLLFNTRNDFFVIGYWNIEKQDKNSFLLFTNIKSETQFYFSK